MQSTTNYGLNIVEGTDIVNPLTQFNPNFTNIDSIMKDNADASIDHATCIKTGTVHAITRTNTDASVFRFTATGNWNSGDTMTVDGTLVSVYVSDGTSPVNGCYVINTEVLASIQGTRVTLYVNSGEASNIYFDNSGTSILSSNVQNAIVELDANVADSKLDTLWTNVSPTDDFNAQNIIINNYVDYNWFLIEIASNKNLITAPTLYTLNSATIGISNHNVYNIGLTGGGKIVQFQRAFNISTSGTVMTLSMGAGNQTTINTYGAAGTSETNNATQIPLKIYGIKTN